MSKDKKKSTNNPSQKSVVLGSSVKASISCQSSSQGLVCQKIQEQLILGANLSRVVGVMERKIINLPKCQPNITLFLKQISHNFNIVKPHIVQISHQD